MLDALAERLDDLTEAPERLALLHGDVRSGNVRVASERGATFIDPAIHFGQPEIAFAFTTLFGPFTDVFDAASAESAGIAPGFLELRCDFYNLYPLLVHVRLFGSGYCAPIDDKLRRHGL